MRKLKVSFAAVIGTAALCCAAPAGAEMSETVRRQAFEAVWNRIYRSHFDPTFGGVDWKAVKIKYAPQVTKVKTDAEFYDLLERMIGELKQSHFAIIPPQAYALNDAAAAQRGSGITGLTVGLVQEQVTVLRVAADSPAAKAGIRPGDILEAVEGKPLAQTVEKLKAQKMRPAEAAVVTRLVLQGSLSGNPGTLKTVTLQNAANEKREVALTLVAGPAKREALPGFPPMTVEFEKRRLDDNIGYIRFTPFTILTMDDIRKAAQEFANAAGVILDLRGNPGGLAPVTYAVAGLYSAKADSLGTMTMRGATLKFTVNPQAPKYSGPLVILTDELSMSSSEILAGGLQTMKRAVVIGRPSPGMVLPSTTEKLPGGARLQYAYADFKTTAGILLEGRGVTPDVPISLTRESLYRDGDPDVTAARAHINNIKNRKAQVSTLKEKK